MKKTPFGVSGCRQGRVALYSLITQCEVTALGFLNDVHDMIGYTLHICKDFRIDDTIQGIDLFLHQSLNLCLSIACGQLVNAILDPFDFSKHSS